MNIRTPLAKVRGLGSAKEGTDHFWHQRLTAVANIPLVIFFVILVVSLVGQPYAVVTATLGGPLTAIFTMLAVVSITYHMRLGMQVVIEDYVHTELTKVLLVMANTFFCFFIAFASLYAILKLSFGG